MANLLLLCLTVIFAGVAVFLIIWLYFILPARMARQRGRHPLGWVLLSLIVSPLLAVLLLAILGDAPERRA